MNPHHRPNTLPQCQNLQAQVDSVLNLVQQEPSLQARVDTSAVRSSLKKAIAPTFEIVFAGAFSAGKSMLINALLERELLYSAEGHATGTECQIAYAEPEQERVVLTFLSEAEVHNQVQVLCTKLGMVLPDSLQAARISPDPDLRNSLSDRCTAIIQQEGGESKSEKAKQASALKLLLQGFSDNRSIFMRSSMK